MIQQSYFMDVNLIMKAFLLLSLIVLITARDYPLYRQCNTDWAHDKINNSIKTICESGSLITSVSMALAGINRTCSLAQSGNITLCNPSTLNKWLTQNGGYVSSNLFIWKSVQALGLTFEGFVSNTNIKSNLDAGKVVVCNVHEGSQWVLAHGYHGSQILVNDPGYSTTEYDLSEIVNGYTGVYTVNKKSNPQL